MTPRSSNIPSDYEPVIKAFRDAKDAFITHWLNYSLFSVQFWCIITACIICIGIWIKFVDKSRLLEMCLLGIMWQTVSETIDQIGTTYMLWEYPIKVVPLYTVFITNIALIPIGFMLVHQYTKTWKSYIIVSVLVSAFAAFVIEPIYIWTNMYVLLRWNIIYSFGSYILLAIVNRLIIEKLKKIQFNKPA